jgi:hypothetical protein
MRVIRYVPGQARAHPPQDFSAPVAARHAIERPQSASSGHVDD